MSKMRFFDIDVAAIATYADTRLSLCRVGLGDARVKALAEGLGVNTRVQTLDLGWNQLRDPSAIALAEVLKVNTTLRILFLDVNCIEVPIAFAEALRVNTTLQELNLDENLIGDQGAEALAEALKFNTNLKKLHLSHNRIGDRGAEALAECLKVNVTLKALFCWNRGIGDLGTLAFAEALAVNTSVVTLGLFTDRIGDSAWEALALTRLTRSTPYIGVIYPRPDALYLKVLSRALRIDVELVRANLSGVCNAHLLSPEKTIDKWQCVRRCLLILYTGRCVVGDVLVLVYAYCGEFPMGD